MKLLYPHIKKPPKISVNFRDYRIAQNNIHTRLDNIKTQRRIESMQSLAFSFLRIAGYVSLGFLSMYFLNRINLFLRVSKCIPKSLCIKI